MSIPTQTGKYNLQLDIIEPASATTWADLDDWTVPNWNPNATSIVWISDFIDLGTIRTVNFVIETDAQGDVSYEIISSNTGFFAGEETNTIIAQGATSVSSFSGRFFYVVATVTDTSRLPVLRSMKIRTSSSTSSIVLDDVDTSTLAGTTSARTLNFGRTVSGVTNLQITVKETSNFTLESYVTDYPTSNTLIPRIVDKTVPSIALVGLDNVPRDAVIDVVAEILPEQYMNENNLLVR